MAELRIVADDFGYSHPRNDGINKAANGGFISATSLMVTAFASEAEVCLGMRWKCDLGGFVAVGMYLHTHRQPTTSTWLASQRSYAS